MDFLQEDVPDPTDFPPQNEAPGLRILDGSFRCNICGELYEAPVTVVCGHCFCSTCIRTSLQLKQECPICRRPTGEAHIRPNPALESVISAWHDARPYVLRIIKQEEKLRKEDRPMKDIAANRKRKRANDTTFSSEFASSWHHQLPSSDNIAPKSPKVEGMTIPSSDPEEDELTEHHRSLVPKADDLVECPMCQKQVKFKSLNFHMDNNCQDPSSSNAKQSWSKLMSGAKSVKQKGKQKKKESDRDSDDDYRLAISTYTTLKDKQLKYMLLEQDLPVTGDRSIWEQRHQRWVVLFNSNLDKSVLNRKNRTELKKDLQRWEEDTIKKKKPVINDIKCYQKEQNSEFKKLIEAARPIKKAANASLKSSSPQNVPATSSPPREIILDSDND